MPIYEPGLDRDRRHRTSAKAGCASPPTSPPSVAEADAVFIAVGTPSRRGDGHADLTFVHAAAREIAAALERLHRHRHQVDGPGRHRRRVEAIIREERPDADFAVVSNPEFLREGAAIEDFKRPNRIVVGTTDPRAREVMHEVYRPLYLNQSPILFTDRRTSELIKYAANAFLATKITFINEIADLCEKVGADVQDVARGIGLDNRIGPKFLHPGPGFGGSCFPKDTLALIRTGEDAGAPLRIVSAVNAINETRKPTWPTASSPRSGRLDRTAAPSRVLGLTFKPNTDDMREAPSLDHHPALCRRPAPTSAPTTRRAWMPRASRSCRASTSPPMPMTAPPAPTRCVIVTEWESFRALDLARIKSSLKQPLHRRPPQHLPAGGGARPRLHLLTPSAGRARPSATS